MSSNLNITPGSNITAPTPQNTPLTQAPIALGLSRPTVPDISEDNEDDGAEVNEGDLSETIKSHMLGLVQGKLAELVGKSSGYIESLPAEVKANVEALKGIQVKQNELQNQYKLECLELEKKYLGLQKPLYDRRSAIINGKAQATPEEIESGEEVSAEDDEDYVALPKDVTPSPSGIPEFWLTALRNHVGLADLITDRDAGALKHLIDVQLQYLDNTSASASTDATTVGKPGFKILFTFSPNDFFTNEVLEKTYLYQEKVGYSGDFVYDRAIGTEIKWKEDKDLTKEFEIKKQRNKTTNRTRLVRKAKPADSFFNFFYPPVPPTEEAIESGDFEDEELEEIEEKLEVDYQIGEDLKEKVIPRAIDYFTGKALEYDFDEEEEGFDLGDSDDEDSEDEDSDSDDAAPRRRAPKAREAPLGANAGAEECKQQ